jgi:hypothetical protein
MSWLKQNKKIILSVIILLVISIPAIYPLFKTGFPLTDDGNWMVIRFSAFYEALRNGQFPVRFLMRLNNGYGYPVADFLYPLFMYLSTPIHILGINFVNSIKVLLTLCIILSSVFSFFWLRRLFNNLSSFVGAILYTFFPYHLFDVYKRGSVGEVLALSVLPFILWQIERGSMLWISVGTAFLIVSHNTLALLFMLLIIPYMLLNIFVSREKVVLLRLYFLSLLLGLGMSSFFWIPAIYDLQYTVFSKTQISNINNYFSDFGLIGISTIIVLVLIIFFIIIKTIKISMHRLTLLMFVIALFSIYLSTGFSSFFWTILPSSFIQFPFRLLSLAIPSIAFLAAVSISVLSLRKQFILTGVLLIIVLFSSYSYLTPKNYQYFPDTFYSTNQDTTTVKNEYMPKWAKEVPISMANKKVQNLNGSEVIDLTLQSANKVVFSTYLMRDRIIQVNIIYFPGWTAYVNNKEGQILHNNPKGLIQIPLSRGSNQVSVIFKETWVRLLSDGLSLISLLGLIGYLLTVKIIKLKTK